MAEAASSVAPIFQLELTPTTTSAGLLTYDTDCSNQLFADAIGAVPAESRNAEQ